MHNTKLPDIPTAQKSKDLVFLFTAIVVIILIVVFAKHIGKIFGGLFGTVESAGQGIGEALGITPSQDDKIVKAAQTAQIPSPLYSYSFKQYYQPKAPAGTPLITTAQAHNYISQLLDSKSFFQFADNTSKAVGVFSQLSSKIMVSWLAYRFLQEEGRDLFEWLTSNFKSEIVAQIVNNVNAKPLFK